MYVLTGIVSWIVAGVDQTGTAAVTSEGQLRTESHIISSIGKIDQSIAARSELSFRMTRGIFDIHRMPNIEVGTQSLALPDDSSPARHGGRQRLRRRAVNACQM